LFRRFALAGRWCSAAPPCHLLTNAILKLSLFRKGSGRSFGGQEQSGLFEQAAEIFFAGDVPAACLAVNARHGFIFHFEPFQANDAEVFFFPFPDLSLAQFHVVL
jgi:hypothetical protein